MAGRALLMTLRRPGVLNIRQIQNIQNSRAYSDTVVPLNYKYGNREVVGFGMNGEAGYLDLVDFPYPGIRYKEITPDLQVLKEKEKGDWKKLSIAEKKELYRISFRQTLAEVQAPTGEWKSIVGLSLIGISLGLWIFIGLKTFAYPPLPHTFSEEYQRAMYERMVLLDVNPIWGMNRKD